MALTQYEQAKLWLNDLNSKIKSLENEMMLIESNYRNAINIAKNNDFMQNYINPLNNKYLQRKKEIANVLEVLNKFKYEINKQINKLEFLIQNAKKE